jgi:RNA polymerase-binding transcription factor DksA
MVGWRGQSFDDDGAMAMKHKHDRLRVQLETRLGVILGRLERIEHDLRQTPDRDWTEQATLQENDEVLQGLGDLERAEAVTIRNTLRRMESGDYGFCTVCREPIDQKRLDAVPTADTCLYCAGIS